MSIKNEQRRYSVADSVMADAARRYHDQLSVYYNSFKALDEERFHERFIEEFSAKIDAAANMPSDNMFVSQLVSQNDAINEIRSETVSLVGQAKYFIKKASKGDKRFVDHFGYKNLGDVRDSNNKMILFLESFNVAVSEKRDELIQAKMPESLIAELEAVEVSLNKERKELVETRIKRSDATLCRVALLNEVWDIMVIITDANRYANPGDPIAAKIFSLPYPSKKSKDEK